MGLDLFTSFASLCGRRWPCRAGGREPCHDPKYFGSPQGSSPPPVMAGAPSQRGPRGSPRRRMHGVRAGEYRRDIPNRPACRPRCIRRSAHPLIFSMSFLNYSYHCNRREYQKIKVIRSKQKL